jgi:hypothetical protein
MRRTRQFIGSASASECGESSRICRLLPTSRTLPRVACIMHNPGSSALTATVVFPGIAKSVRQREAVYIFRLSGSSRLQGPRSLTLRLHFPCVLSE